MSFLFRAAEIRWRVSLQRQKGRILLTAGVDGLRFQAGIFSHFIASDKIKIL